MTGNPQSDQNQAKGPDYPDSVPPQEQDQQPGIQAQMDPQPEVVKAGYKPAGKLAGKVAIVTGGDSGIGRSVAVTYALEGADVAVVYLSEHQDAEETGRQVEAAGRRCLLFAGDLGEEAFCQKVAEETAEQFGHIDILVNNAAEQHMEEDIAQIDLALVERTFKTNIIGMFGLTKHVAAFMGEGGSIINTTSVTAYQGSPKLLSYSSTKGAIVAFTRSLSLALIEKGIRVNGVAPGPIWTPFIPSSMPADKVSTFGQDTPMKRPGQPSEVATCFVFLASDDSSYLAGQILHPNGGEVVNA